MISAWHGHAPHPNLPVVLPLLLEHAGFRAVHQRPLTILNRHFHADTFSYWVAQLIAAYATANGGISPDDASRWMDSLTAADEHRCYFFSSVPVLTTAALTAHPI
jgi:arsenite methyltransferase